MSRAEVPKLGLAVGMDDGLVVAPVAFAAADSGGRPIEGGI